MNFSNLSLSYTQNTDTCLNRARARRPASMLTFRTNRRPTRRGGGRLGASARLDERRLSRGAIAGAGGECCKSFIGEARPGEGCRSDGGRAGCADAQVCDRPVTTAWSMRLLQPWQFDRAASRRPSAPYLCSRRLSSGSGFDGGNCLVVGLCVGAVGARVVVRAGAQPYLGPRSGLVPGR